MRDFLMDTKNKSFKKRIILKEEDLPLIIEYKDKRYILILTKNDKLILQKAID